MLALDRLTPVGTVRGTSDEGLGRSDSCGAPNEAEVGMADTTATQMLPQEAEATPCCEPEWRPPSSRSLSRP